MIFCCEMMPYNVKDKRVNSTQKCCKTSSTLSSSRKTTMRTKHLTDSNIRWIITNVSYLFIQKEFAGQRSNTLLNSLLLVKITSNIPRFSSGQAQCERSLWWVRSRTTWTLRVLARIRTFHCLVFCYPLSHNYRLCDGQSPYARKPMKCIEQNW